MKRALASEAEHEVANEERWLLTYADMITLLLALFIVLFAVSTISAKKFQALALGFKESFSPNPGVLPSSNGVLEYDSLTPTAGPQQVQQRPTIVGPTPQASSSPPVTALSAAVEGELKTIGGQVQKAIAATNLKNLVSTSISTRGLVVQVLTDKVFFASDSASLGPQGNQVIDAIGSVLAGTENDIDVEGYTDNQPVVGGPYSSNEELSAVRAASVATRLIDVDGIDPDRVAATGYGDDFPLVPNTSATNRALNRRIDIVVLAPGASQP